MEIAKIIEITKKTIEWLSQILIIVWGISMTGCTLDGMSYKDANREINIEHSEVKK